MSQKYPEKSPVTPSYGQNSHFRPRTGRRNLSESPRPENPSVSRIAAAGGRTIGSTKVAQCERASDEPKISRKLPGGAELRPKTCPKEAGLGFGPVSGQVWPNSDRFWPDDKKNRSIAQNVRNGLPVPMSQKIPEKSLVALKYGQNSHFRPRTGRRNFSKSPRPPKTSKSRIAAAGG